MQSRAGAAFLVAGLVLACRPTEGIAQPKGTVVRQWHGIGVKKGPDCECCGLVFPERFGANDPQQLRLLRELAGGEGRAEELGCYAYSREALEHLTTLATRYQDRGAALVVLSADSDRGVDLGGGELSEAVGSEFMVPVLERFEALKQVLDSQLSKHIASKVCESAMTVGEVDLSRLTASLRRRGLASFAETIKRTCSVMERGE